MIQKIDEVIKQNQDILLQQLIKQIKSKLLTIQKPFDSYLFSSNHISQFHFSYFSYFLCHPLFVDNNSDSSDSRVFEKFSFTTNTFPKNNQKTTVYGIELSSSNKNLLLKIWPNKLLKYKILIWEILWEAGLSIQEILKHTNSKTLTADKLTYWGSSIYIVNNGDMVTPKWQLFSLQAFDAPIQGSSNKQRYYVLYDSTTNQFDKFVPGPMDKLLDIKLPSS